MSTFSISGVHSNRSRTLVSALLLNRDERIAITTNGPHDVPPTRPSSLFLGKCVTGAVQTAPVTATLCSSTWRGVTDGGRVGNPPKTPLGSQRAERISNHSVDDGASVGSAASRDCSRSVEARRQQQRIGIYAHTSQTAKRVCPWRSSACPLRSRWLP